MIIKHFLEDKNQLLFLHIESTSYNCFKNQDFNFSPIFNFHYDSISKSLKYEYTDSLNIFNEIDNLSNITAVVGKNGSGKTTLLKYLMNFTNLPKTRWKILRSMGQQYNSGFIAVYLVNGDIVVRNLTRNVIHLYKDNTLKKTIEPISVDNIENNFTNFTTIYMSMEDRSESSFNIRSQYFIPLTPRQIETFGNAYFKNAFLEFPGIPITKKYFNFENIVLLDYWSSHFYPEDSVKEIDFQIKLFNDLYSMNRKPKIASHFLENEKPNTLQRFLIYNLLKEIEEIGYTFGEKYINFSYNQKSDFDITVELKYIKDDILNNVVNDEHLTYLLKAIEEIKIFDTLSTFKNLSYTKENNITSVTYTFSISLYKLREVFNLIKESDRSFILKYIYFDFDRSDGEIAKLRNKAYLHFISQDNYFKLKNKKILNDNVILLLDEIDVHLHPEWQRIMLNDIISSIEDYFPRKNVQIILTTHSPIVLSDLPSDNIIYLKKDEDCKSIAYKNLSNKTFGANIFDLYNDSFYFDNNILMGEFAKKYIDDLYKKVTSMDNSERNNDNILKEINLIGEPLLKNQLLRAIGGELIHNEKRSRERDEIADKLDKILSLLKNNQK